MKLTRFAVNCVCGVLALAGANVLNAQGTVKFDNPWASGGVGYYGVYYDITGMSFRVSDPSQHGASLARIGVGFAGHPNNGTPHLESSDTLPPSYLIFSRTNGNSFGLTSVDLADPVAPSLSPVSITFNGFKGDGSIVSQTFTTAGSGISTFQTFQFNATFASGLSRVEIPSSFWAMDNLVYVPEPGVASLLLLGLIPFAARKKRQPQ